MATTVDQAGIGDRLRAAREQQRLTLDQLAEQSGLSKPYLSRLESGDRQPSIGALLELSRVLRVRVSAMLGEDLDGTTLAVHHPDEPRRDANGLQIASCSGYADSRALEALRVTVQPNRPASQAARHRGEEWIYVLSGTLELEYAGELHELPAGTTAHFDADRPHRLTTSGAPAEVLLVWTNDNPDPRGVHH